MTLMPLNGLKMALKSWLCFRRSKVNFTSAVVSSLPEWNFTPSRSLKRMVFSSIRVQPLPGARTEILGPAQQRIKRHMGQLENTARQLLVNVEGYRIGVVRHLQFLGCLGRQGYRRRCQGHGTDKCCYQFFHRVFRRCFKNFHGTSAQNGAECLANKLVSENT